MTKSELKNKIEEFILSKDFYQDVNRNYKRDFKILMRNFNLKDNTEIPELVFELNEEETDYMAYVPCLLNVYKNSKNNWEINMNYESKKIIINISNIIKKLTDLITYKLFELISIKNIILDFTRNIILHELIHYIQIKNYDYKLELPISLNKISNENILYYIITESHIIDYYNYTMEFNCVADWYKVIKNEKKGLNLSVNYFLMGIFPLMQYIYLCGNCPETIYRFLLSPEDESDYFESIYLDDNTSIDEIITDAIMEIVNFKVKSDNYLRNPKFYFHNSFLRKK